MSEAESQNSSYVTRISPSALDNQSEAGDLSNFVDERVCLDHKMHCECVIVCIIMKIKRNAPKLVLNEISCMQPDAFRDIVGCFCPQY